MDKVFFKGVAIPVHHKIEVVKIEVADVAVHSAIAPVAAPVPVPAPVVSSSVITGVTAPVLTVVESKPEPVSEPLKEIISVVSVESILVEEPEALVAKAKPKKNKA